jgi:ATP-dependent DNA helicase RecG
LTQKHSSQPFNHDVSDAFFRAGMIESWGRGIEKMVTACEKAGFPLPELRYETSGLWVLFPYKPKGQSGEKLGEKLGEKRAAIVNAMTENPKVTTKELAETLKISTTAIEKKYTIPKSS